MSHQQTATSLYDREHLARILSQPPLSAVAQRRLMAEAKGGNSAAREALIVSNVGLIRDQIMKIESRKWELGPMTAGGVEFTDLFDEGVAALTNSVDKFNPNYGVDFQTYAVKAIQNQLAKTLNSQEDQIRWPAKAAALERRIFQIEDHRRNAGETTPLTDQELADMTGETVTMVSAARSGARVVTSLDVPLESGDTLGNVLADTTPDPVEADLDESVLDRITPADLNNFIAQLDPRYGEPVAKRLIEGKSLEAVARETGVSPTTAAKNIRRGVGQLRRIATNHINQPHAPSADTGDASTGASL